MDLSALPAPTDRGLRCARRVQLPSVKYRYLLQRCCLSIALLSYGPAGPWSCSAGRGSARERTDYSEVSGILENGFLVGSSFLSVSPGKSRGSERLWGMLAVPVAVLPAESKCHLHLGFFSPSSYSGGLCEGLFLLGAQWETKQRKNC